MKFCIQRRLMKQTSARNTEYAVNFTDVIHVPCLCNGCSKFIVRVRNLFSVRRFSDCLPINQRMKIKIEDNFQKLLSTPQHHPDHFENEPGEQLSRFVSNKLENDFSHYLTSIPHHLSYDLLTLYSNPLTTAF